MVFFINQKFCWPKRGLFEKKRIIKNLSVLRFDAFLLMFQIFVLRFSAPQCFLSNWGGRTYIGVSGSRLVKVFLANSKKFLLLHAGGSFTVERDKLYAQRHGWWNFWVGFLVERESMTCEGITRTLQKRISPHDSCKWCITLAKILQESHFLLLVRLWSEKTGKRM